MDFICPAAAVYWTDDRACLRSDTRLSVPKHGQLRIGTLNAILRAVAQAKGVSRDDIVASL
jgi:hypothetical protein